MPHAGESRPSESAADLRAAREVLGGVADHLQAGVETRAREAGSAWTVGQQLVHICLVASSISTARRRLTRGGGGEDGSTPETKALLRCLEIPRGVATAPPGLTRPEPPTRGEVRAAYEKALRRWDDLVTRAASIAQARGTVPHPLLGPLDAQEWVRFAGVHGRHHLAIVDEILVDGGHA